MKNRTITFLLFYFCLIGNFVKAQTNIDYSQYENINVYISESKYVQKLFDKKYKESPEFAIFKRNLRDLFRSYFVDALLTDYSPGKITNESGLSTACITAALDKYRNEVLIARTRQVDLELSFDPDQMKHYKKLYDGHLTADKIEAKDVTGRNSMGAKSFPNDKITIKNAFTDFKKRVFKFEDSKTGCSFTTVRDFYPDKTELPGDWKYTADKTFSIKSVMFHEIVHLALLHGDSQLANERFCDDATVEDITLKIYPKEAQGFNPYEYKYNFAIWNWLYNKHDPKGFEFWLPYPHGRLFNPPVVTENGNVRLRYVKYEPNDDDVRVISQLYINDSTGKLDHKKDLKHQEDTFCDDARCQNMVDGNGKTFDTTDFVIPYLCKCDPNTPCTSQMSANRSGSSDRSLGGTIANSFSDSCCGPQPPASGSGDSGGPGGDACDDNYSSSSGVLMAYDLAPEAVILSKGYWQEAMKLYGGLKAAPEFTANALLESTPFLIIPTGGLFGQENDSTLKAILQEYVRLGGVIFVYAQQFADHIDKVVPISEGESLRSYGWRQDQACWAWSYNLKTMHPALAAMAAGGIVTDGQFPVYPSNSTILLRKGSNQEPVLLYYSYGSGTVILTSMYTDWGAAHSQTTASELRLVRDLVTFAKNPNLAIPMFDLTANPTPEISLQIKMKNGSEYPATSAKITVYTPDRKTVLYQSEAAVSLAAGTETEIPLAFMLPELADIKLGICHTDYELYDSENNLVQMATEADSGRFTPFRLKLTQKPEKDLDCWLTTENEFVY